MTPAKFRSVENIKTHVFPQIGKEIQSKEHPELFGNESFLSILQNVKELFDLFKSSEYQSLNEEEQQLSVGRKLRDIRNAVEQRLRTIEAGEGDLREKIAQKQTEEVKKYIASNRNEWRASRIEKRILQTLIKQIDEGDVASVLKTVENFDSSFFLIISEKGLANHPALTKIIESTHSLIYESSNLSESDQTERLYQIKQEIINKRVEINEARQELEKKVDLLKKLNRNDDEAKLILDEIDQFNQILDALQQIEDLIDSSDNIRIKKHEIDYVLHPQALNENEQIVNQQESREEEPQGEYQFALLFILDVRKNLPQLGENFFQFPGLEIKGRDSQSVRNLQKFLQEVFSDKGDPQVRVQVQEQVIKALLLMTKKHLLDKSGSAFAVSFPASEWSTSNLFMVVEGDANPNPDNTFDGISKRMPRELQTAFQFYRKKYISLSLTHSFASSYEHLFGGVKAKEQAILDWLRQHSDEMATEYFLAGIFSQEKMLNSHLERDRVWQFGNLTRLAGAAWDRAIRKLPDGGRSLSRNVPYSIRSPNPLYQEILEVVSRKYLTFMGSNIPSNEVAFNQLSDEDKGVVELAVRQAFISHRLLINEADADPNAIEQGLSQELNAFLYYAEGKTIDDPSANKKFGPDTGKYQRMAVSAGEFIKGVVTLPEEAIEVVPWPEYFDLMKRLYAGDGSGNVDESKLSNLRRIKEYVQTLGLFTYSDMFDDSGNWRFDHMAQKARVIRIKPEYRIFNDSDNEVDVMVVDSRNIKNFSQDGTSMVSLTLSLNEILFRSRVAESFTRTNSAGEDVIEPAIHFDSVTSASIDNYIKYLEAAMRWHQLAITNSEDNIRNLERVNVQVRRFRGKLVDQALLKVDTSLKALKGRFSVALGKLELSKLDPSRQLTPEEKEQREKDQQVYQSFMDTLYAMIVVRPDEIGATEFKETLNIANFYEPAIHYLISAAGTSEPSLVLDESGNNGLRPRTDDDYVNLDLLYTMFRDLSEGKDSNAIYFPPILDEWVEMYEKSTYEKTVPGVDSNRNKAEKSASELGMRLELLFLAINLYLNRYIIESLPNSNLNLFRYENVETVSGAPVLTPDKLKMVEEVFTRYILEIIGDSKSVKNDNTGLVRELIGQNYSEEVVRRRIIDVMERLGLYGSLEATVVAMKWYEDKSLFKLPPAASIDVITAEGQRITTAAEKITHQ